jgi:T5SS/PEP-CTERM-associated repeat protein
MWTNRETLQIGGPFNGIGRLEITNGGAVSSTRGSIGDDPDSGAGSVTISGAGSAWINAEELVIGDAGRGSVIVAGGGRLVSGHSIMADQENANGAVTIASSTWTNTGNLTVGRLGTATLRIDAGGSVSNVHAFVGTSAEPLSIATVDGAGSRWHSTGDLTIGRQGSGNSGTLIISNGAIASVDGLLLVEPTGVIAGNSTADANVINRGEVRPGLLAIESSGALHVEGSYLQSQSGRLTVRLGGTTPADQYDQLKVTGGVTLNGILSVILANSFQPAAGNIFDVLDGSSITGTFSSVQLPALAAGLTWNTSQLYTAGVLSVSSSFVAADFDENGVVNGADLTRWKTGFGANSSATHTQGNADGDQDVDGADFLVWQRQLGAMAVGPVPEPAAIVLMASATLTMFIAKVLSPI